MLPAPAGARFATIARSCSLVSAASAVFLLRRSRLHCACACACACAACVCAPASMPVQVPSSVPAPAPMAEPAPESGATPAPVSAPACGNWRSSKSCCTRARSSPNSHRRGTRCIALTQCHPKPLSCTAAPRAGLKRGSRGRRGSGRAAVPHYRDHHSGGRHSTGRISATNGPILLSLKPWTRQMPSVSLVPTASTAALDAPCYRFSTTKNPYPMKQTALCYWRPV